MKPISAEVRPRVRRAVRTAAVFASAAAVLTLSGCYYPYGYYPYGYSPYYYPTVPSAATQHEVPVNPDRSTTPPPSSPQNAPPDYTVDPAYAAPVYPAYPAYYPPYYPVYPAYYGWPGYYGPSLSIGFGGYFCCGHGGHHR